MKILYSHRTRSADGQYVHIRSLTEALSARGHALTMCGPKEGGVYRKLDAGEGRGGAQSQIPKPIYELAEFGYSVPGFKKLLSEANRVSPDILYERYNLFYHAGARLARMKNIPLILEVNAPLVEERTKHGGIALKPLAKWSEESLWRCADAVLPVTKVLADKVVQSGVAPTKVTVIQNGVDQSFLDRPSGAEIREKYRVNGKIVLGFTGFVRDWHGVDRVLRFLSLPENAHCVLLLVGDGPAREGLEALSQELGIQDRFFVTGVVQRDVVAAHVAAFDIALQPAVVDYASPLKLFEYMALEKPIIAPDSANIKEVLSTGKDALLFNSDDQNALFEVLRTMIVDDTLRLKLGAAARVSLLRQKLTWAHNAERIEIIAEQLLRERHG